MKTTELWYFYMYHDGTRRYRRVLLTADSCMGAKLRVLGLYPDWGILRSHMAARFIKSESLELIDIMELE